MTITNNTDLYYYSGALDGRRWFDGILSTIRPGGDANGAMLDTNMHYTVSKQPIYTTSNSLDEPVLSTKHSAVWTHDMLTGESRFAEAVVGKETYTPIQNPSIIEPLFELDEIKWGLGGTLNQGMRCFLHGVIGDQYDIDGDPHLKGVVASWSHDGTGALKVMPFVTRVWCANQIPSMFGKRRGGVAIKHTVSAPLKVNILAESVASALLQVQDYETVMSRLIHKKGIEPYQVEDYIAALVPIPAKLLNSPEQYLSTGEKRSLTMAQNKRAAIRDIYWNSLTQENLRGTAAGLFHAAVEAADFRFSGERGKRVLLGTDVEFKQTAMEFALAA